MKHVALVAAVDKVTPLVVRTHSAISSGEPTSKELDKINEVTGEESVQMSESLTQKFEHLSPNNLPSAQSFLKINWMTKIPTDEPKDESLKLIITRR